MNVEGFLGGQDVNLERTKEQAWNRRGDKSYWAHSMHFSFLQFTVTKEDGLLIYKITNGDDSYYFTGTDVWGPILGAYTSQDSWWQVTEKSNSNLLRGKWGIYWNMCLKNPVVCGIQAQQKPAYDIHSLVKVNKKERKKSAYFTTLLSSVSCSLWHSLPRCRPDGPQLCQAAILPLQQPRRKEI